MTKKTGELHRGYSGHALGNAKQAAQRQGVSLDEWIDRRKAGECCCFRCKKWKSKNEFSVDKSRRYGRSNSCKACTSIASKASKYGLTYQGVVEILSRNKCEICQRENQKWELDHDHSTGKFRGLLCSRCNSALGMFAESEELMLNAIQYLKRKEVSRGSE